MRTVTLGWVLLGGCTPPSTPDGGADPTDPTIGSDPDPGVDPDPDPTTETETEPEPPTAVCGTSALVDTSSPDAVVGDGTADSCTESALREVAAAGGVIVFDCGVDPVTLTVTSTIVFDRESVLDGMGLVTLSGGGTTRILYLDSAYDQTGPRLVVQRLVFQDGQSDSDGDDTAVGGGAIYRDGGSLTVIDSVFVGNRAPSPGQDIAGGAIYAFGGGETLIVGSRFVDNAASNGGAVGSLNGDLIVIDSTFTENTASGVGGNPGNGGCGGAIYQDGADEHTDLCGVTLQGNQAGHIGGGFFRVSNEDNGTLTIDRTTVDDNRVTPEDDGLAGGLYLQGLSIEMQSSTISRNQAFYNGGVWFSEGPVALTNVTIAENTAFGSNGGGIWLADAVSGTLLNVTLANNRSTATDQIAGAIFGAGLSLQNTLVSGNTAMWVPGCNEVHAGADNLEWPDGAECTNDPLVADPELGTLGDNGGVTETLLPSEQSPARALATSGCPPFDQRGEPRVAPCTVGAVEVTPVVR